jgi:predicted N-acetyltransferase YhbS
MNREFHYRGTTCHRGAHGIACGRGGWPCDRSYRLLSVTISDGILNWYGLGPVSVLPRFQRQGIGKALIREGLSRLKDMNAQGCCLVEHPGYYIKFGFKNMSGLVHEGVLQEVFFALSFDGYTPQGIVAFHEGFKADGQPKSEADDLKRA